MKVENIQVRKIITEASGNTFYMFFNIGELQNPIFILTEIDFDNLVLEMARARKDCNILSVHKLLRVAGGSSAESGRC